MSDPNREEQWPPRRPISQGAPGRAPNPEHKTLFNVPGLPKISRRLESAEVKALQNSPPPQEPPEMKTVFKIGEMKFVAPKKAKAPQPPLSTKPKTVFSLPGGFKLVKQGKPKVLPTYHFGGGGQGAVTGQRRPPSPAGGGFVRTDDEPPRLSGLGRKSGGSSSRQSSGGKKAASKRKNATPFLPLQPPAWTNDIRKNVSGPQSQRDRRQARAAAAREQFDRMGVVIVTGDQAEAGQESQPEPQDEDTLAEPETQKPQATTSGGAAQDIEGEEWNDATQRSESPGGDEQYVEAGQQQETEIQQTSRSIAQQSNRPQTIPRSQSSTSSLSSTRPHPSTEPQASNFQSAKRPPPSSSWKKQLTSQQESSQTVRPPPPAQFLKSHSSSSRSSVSAVEEESNTLSSVGSFGAGDRPKKQKQIVHAKRHGAQSAQVPAVKRHPSNRPAPSRLSKTTFPQTTASSTIARSTDKRGLGDMARTYIEAMVEGAEDFEVEQAVATTFAMTKVDEAASKGAVSKMNRGLGVMERTYLEAMVETPKSN